MTRTRTRAELPESRLIDLLGGTAAVGKLCKVKAASVSDWRVSGIPEARMMFIELKKPKIVAAYRKELEEAARASQVPA